MFNDSLMGLEDDFVDKALLGAEASVDRERACDVGGVVAVLIARVEQEDITVAKRFVVVRVMQGGRGLTRGGDRVVGDELGRERVTHNGTTAQTFALGPPRRYVSYCHRASTSYSIMPGRIAFMTAR